MTNYEMMLYPPNSLPSLPGSWGMTITITAAQDSYTSKVVDLGTSDEARARELAQQQLDAFIAALVS